MPAFDAAVYSSMLRDRLYECKFEKSRSSGNGSQGQTRGKMECGERWQVIHSERETVPLDTLFLTGSGVLPVPINDRVGRAHGSAPGETEEDGESNRSQVELVGLTAQDLGSAMRKVRDKFTPAFQDEGKTRALQNDHRALVLQAAGSNIELAQSDPVRLGTQETIEAVVIGDPVTCIGLSRVDPKTGRMTLSPPSDPSPFGDGGDGHHDDKRRPFVISRMDKVEIGKALRRDASAHDTAGLLCGVPAGVLFAAGILFTGSSLFGSGSAGGAATPE